MDIDIAEFARVYRECPEDREGLKDYVKEKLTYYRAIMILLMFAEIEHLEYGKRGKA